MAEAKSSSPRKSKKETGVRSEWPYNKDHYIATESIAARSHHEGGPVEEVQEELAVKVTGVFDEKTRDALIKYQQDNDLPVTGVVDADLWEHFAGKG
jgi:peptidoglycan hydrolase-like protein with peptidoglycan-binding domain